jgi:hypothetical protein
MPAEAIRLQRRLGTRDRWFIALLLLAVLLGSASAVAVSRLSSSDASADAGCVSITRASWMGAATFRACGAEAVTFCRTSARGDEEIAAKCAEAGLPTTRR